LEKRLGEGDPTTNAHLATKTNSALYCHFEEGTGEKKKPQSFLGGRKGGQKNFATGTLMY